MASKGKGKGKGLSKKFDLDPQKKMNTLYEGSVDNTFFIEAEFQKDRWIKARIIECRLAKDYDTSKKRMESSYEYYIHYQGINRRMDEWVTFNRIRKTDQKITGQDIRKKIKKNQKNADLSQNTSEEGMDVNAIIAHQEYTKIKTIDRIQLGKFRCEAWYYSPYPPSYHNIQCLYICEFCLSFFTLQNQLKRHSTRCLLFHPPGDQIYRDQENKLAMFEVDGFKNPPYCQNLCYLSKLFLDHKNLYYDMNPFLFYVLCEFQNNEYHLTGYFSKEKQSQLGYNLSCILVLPFHQRKGYGKFLIDFSYQLSLKQGKIGTPQRPLSDLGKATYLAWWTNKIIQYIRLHQGQGFSPSDITKETGIRELDVLWTMQKKGMVKYHQGYSNLCIDPDFLKSLYKGSNQNKPLKSQNIRWVPYKKKWEAGSLSL